MRARTIVLTAVASSLFAFGSAHAQSAAQSAYDAQMREYYRQQQQYNDARAQYDADMNRYNGAPTYYREEAYEPARYAPFESLASITDQNLMNKAVQSIDGEYVGHIISVAYNGNLVAEVQVMVTPGRITRVTNNSLRYDKGADIVVTDLTADQMYDRSHLDW